MADDPKVVRLADRLPDFGKPDPAMNSRAIRMASAMQTAIKNLESSELVLFPTVAHVVASLKDALNG